MGSRGRGRGGAGEKRAMKKGGNRIDGKRNTEGMKKESSKPTKATFTQQKIDS